MCVYIKHRNKNMGASLFWKQKAEVLEARNSKLGLTKRHSLGEQH